MLRSSGAVLAGALACASPPATALSRTDTDAVRSVIERYVGGWLTNDSAAVMGSLGPDAVFTPHHGIMPLVGDSAIRAWWFPPPAPGSPAFRVIRFSLEPEEIGGTDSLAYAWGALELAWVTTSAARVDTSTNAGTYLVILRRQPDASWRIVRLTSSDTLPRPR